MCYINCYALRIICQYVNDIIDDLLNNNVMWKIASTMCNHASWKVLDMYMVGVLYHTFVNSSWTVQYVLEHHRSFIFVLVAAELY